MSAVVVNLNSKTGRDSVSCPRVRTNCITVDHGVCSVVIKLERKPADLIQCKRKYLELAGERQGAILAIDLNFGLDTVNTRIGRNLFQWLALAVAPVRELVILRPRDTDAFRRDNIVSSIAALIRHCQRRIDRTATICNAELSFARRRPIDAQLDGITIFVVAIARAHLA